MPQKPSLKTALPLAKTSQVSLVQILPEVCNKEFLNYLELDQDECPDQNKKFLEYLKSGLITLEYKHLVLALKNGHVELLAGIFEQLSFFQKTYVFSYDKKSREKYNLFHYLADKTKLRARLRDNPDKISKIADILLANDVQINHLDKNHKTPLILAVKHENEELFLKLLNQPHAIISHFDDDDKNALDYALELSNAKKTNREEYFRSLNSYFLKLLNSGILIINASQSDDDRIFDLQLSKIELILDIAFDRIDDFKIDSLKKELLFLTIINSPCNQIFHYILCFDCDKVSLNEIIDKFCKMGSRDKFLEKFVDTKIYKDFKENRALYQEIFEQNFLLYIGIKKEMQVLDSIYCLLQSSKTNSSHSFQEEISKISGEDLVMISKKFYPQNSFLYYEGVLKLVMEEIFKKEDNYQLFTELFSSYDSNYFDFKEKNARNYFVFGFLLPSFEAISKSNSSESFPDIVSLISKTNFAYYNFFNFFESDEEKKLYLFLLGIYRFNNQIFVKKNHGVLIIPLLRPETRSKNDLTSFLASQVIDCAGQINRREQDLKLVSYCFLEEMSAKDIYDFIINVEQKYYQKTDLVDFEISKNSSKVYNSFHGFVSYCGEYLDGKFHGKGVLDFRLELMEELKKIIGVLKLKISAGSIPGIDPNFAQYFIKKFENFFAKPFKRYVGEFRNGLFHGYGYLEMIDGSIYQGQFKDGNFHGIGAIFHKKQTRLESYQGKFKEGKIFVLTQEKTKALLDVFSKENKLGLKTLVEIQKTASVLSDEQLEKKSSQIDYKESLMVARFISESFAKLSHMAVQQKLKDEAKLLDLKKELSILKKALEYAELKMQKNNKIFEINLESLSKFNKVCDFSKENIGLYGVKLFEKQKKIIEERDLLALRIDQYRQNVKELQDFIETSEEKLKSGLVIFHKKAQGRKQVLLEQFLKVFDFYEINKRLKISEDETRIIDLEQGLSVAKLDDDFIADLVNFLNSENLVQKIKQQKLTLVDKVKLDDKIKEILEVEVDKELLENLSKSSQELLARISLDLKVLKTSSSVDDFIRELQGIRTLKIKTKRVIDPSGEEGFTNQVEEQNQGEEQENEEVFSGEAEQSVQEDFKVTARYTSSQVSQLWNLLCGVDIESEISPKIEDQFKHEYHNLKEFTVGCANIDDEDISDLEQIAGYQLKIIFHKELDILVEGIALDCQYDSREQSRLRSHLYIHNASCIGGDNLKEYLQKNYQKIFLDGKIVGEIEGLGHASGANDEDLKKSIWTIRKLTKILQKYQESQSGPENPLSLKKFDLAFQDKMILKKKESEKSFSGSLELVIFENEDFFVKLCDYFSKNPVNPEQTELLEVKDLLLNFLKSGFKEISDPQTNFKDLKSDFVDEVKRINGIEDHQEIFKQLLDSEFSITEFLCIEGKDQISQLKKFCENQYSLITKHFQEVEVLKSQAGLRNIGIGPSKLQKQGLER